MGSGSSRRLEKERKKHSEVDATSPWLGAIQTKAKPPKGGDAKSPV
jgi:hypothetical protein